MNEFVPLYFIRKTSTVKIKEFKYNKITTCKCLKHDTMARLFSQENKKMIC